MNEDDREYIKVILDSNKRELMDGIQNLEARVDATEVSVKCLSTNVRKYEPWIKDQMEASKNWREDRRKIWTHVTGIGIVVAVGFTLKSVWEHILNLIYSTGLLK